MLIRDRNLIIAKRRGDNRWDLDVSRFTAEECSQVNHIIFIEYPSEGESRCSLLRVVRALDHLLYYNFRHCAQITFQGHKPDVRECDIIFANEVALRVIDCELSREEREAVSEYDIHFEPLVTVIDREDALEMVRSRFAQMCRYVHRAVGNFFSHGDATVNPEANTTHMQRSTDELEAYTRHTRDYVNGFVGQEKYSEEIGRLALNEAEQGELEEKFIDPITYAVMNIPVTLHETNFDLDTLLSLQNREHPITRAPFDYREIAAARVLVATPLQEFIDRVKNRIADEAPDSPGPG